MICIIRFILLFALVITLGNWTNELLPEYSQEETVVSVPSFSQYKNVANRQSPYSSDAELGGIGINIHQQGTSRILRVNFGKSLFELRSIVQKLAERDASLAKHRERICDNSVLSTTNFLNEYYVFALRHIII